jgi:outer membrane protein OmpU
MNIKKIGLTALASSLVATSVYAGELAVSGSAKISWSGYDGNARSTAQKDTASGIGMDQELSASGSAELDNGMTVSLSHALTSTGSGSSTSSITLDMGDMGSLSFSDQDAGAGLAGLDDMTPSAYEEVWDGVSSSTNGFTFAEMGTGRGFGYSNTVGGATISAGWSDNLTGANNSDGSVLNAASSSSSSSVAVVYPVGDSGLTVYGGVGSEGQPDGKELDHTTIGAKYAFGPITVGYQVNDEDDSDSTSTTTDLETQILGVSFAVNENLSISYGQMTTDKSGSATDQETDGVSIGYSMGGMTISAYQNEVDNLAHSAGQSLEKTEILVTFAF